MSASKLLSRCFRPPVYEAWEWAVMRVLLVWPLLTVTAMNASRFELAAQPHPVGVAQFVDLTWLADPGVRAFLVPACWVAVALYGIGWLPLLSTGFLFLVTVGYGTLMNSQGAIHHTAQIIALVLLAQVFALLRPYLGKRPEGRRGALANHAQANRLIRYSVHAIAAAYVASAISKLYRSGGEWVANVPNIALQFEKNRAMAYYNYLETPESEPGMAMASWVLAHPTLAGLLFGTGLVLELLAFLALAGRLWALLFGLGLIGLHMSVSTIMGLGFAYNKMFLFIFFVNLPFWIVWARRRSEGKRDLAV